MTPPPPPPPSPRRSKRLLNDDNIVKDNNEVSMTIKDSNKLRESLGLRKLDVNNDNNAAEGSSNKPKLLYNDNDDDNESYNIKDVIRKRRDKRIHDNLISGNTLGEINNKEEGSTVEEWINKSRKEQQDNIVNNNNEEYIEYRESKKLRKDKKGSDNIKMKVAHNIEDLKEGDTILTMKDKPILACDIDDDEDDDDIVLEEAGGVHALAQKEKEDLWKKEKRRRAWDPAAHWDDDDDEDNNGGILDKYTTIEDRAKADARRRGFMIAVGGNNNNTGEDTTLQAELNNDVEARLKEITKENKRRSMMQSIGDGSSLHIQSDVMDSKEASKFIKRRNKEARKAIRKCKDIIEGGDIIIPPPKRTLEDDDDDLEDGEEDEELYRQLERQKLVEDKIKARSLIKEEPLDYNESISSNIIDLDNGASYLQTHLIDDKVKYEKDDNTTTTIHHHDDDDDGGGGKGMMSRASEFCASIQTPVELKKAQKDEEFGAQKAYRESRRRMLKRGGGGGNTNRDSINKEEEESDNKDEATSDNIMDDDNMSTIHDDNNNEDDDEEEEFNARNEAMKDEKVDDGAACAIRYFAERGMMSSGDQDSFNSYDPGKRPMISEEDELRIDHRDEFGRVQSAKEAFRTMSWRFHGKGPHWKNVERRVNRIQNDVKRRQETSQVAPTLRALERVQKKEGNSYMLLTGNTGAASSNQRAG